LLEPENYNGSKLNNNKKYKNKTSPSYQHLKINPHHFLHNLHNQKLTHLQGLDNFKQKHNDKYIISLLIKEILVDICQRFRHNSGYSSTVLNVSHQELLNKI